MKEKSDIVYDTTVVIAEDELLVRIGIKSSVDWEKNGFKLLGEAADGNEAIQMVRKFLPHILLLDIKMPGMSGLDILKIIQLEKIPTKVIIISGLDDFMSVKSAMQSGAYDYIHKPRMGYEDLLKIMLQIQQDCRKEERKSLLQEEVSPEVLFLQKIAGDEKPNEQEIFSSETKKLFEERSFCFIYSSLVGVARKKQQKVNFDEKVLYKTTENLITEFCSQRKNIWFIVPKQGRYFFLLTTGFYDGAFIERKAEETAIALRSMVKRFINMDLVSGISSWQNQPDKILETCGQAHTAYEAAFFYNSGIQKYSSIRFADEEEMKECSRLAESMGLSDGIDNIGIHIEKFSMLCRILGKAFCMSRRQLIYHLITEFCSQRKNIWFIVPKQGRYFFLLTTGFYDGAFIERKAEETAIALRSMVKRFINMDLVSGISSWQNQPDKILETCGQAHTAYEAAFFYNSGIQKYSSIRFADEEEMKECSRLAESMGLSDGIDNIGIHIEKFSMLCRILGKAFCMSRRQLIYHLQNMMYQISEQDVVLCEEWYEKLYACNNLEDLEEVYTLCLKDYRHQRGRRYGNTVGMIAEYLQKNYSSDISLALLSRVFHLNEHYISRVFKEETGENFLSYLNRIRIEEAKKLLLESDKKIYEIAEETGFQSSVNFNYVFNRFAGISPKMFREQFGKK